MFWAFIEVYPQRYIPRTANLSVIQGPKPRQLTPLASNMKQLYFKGSPHQTPLTLHCVHTFIVT